MGIELPTPAELARRNEVEQQRRMKEILDPKGALLLEIDMQRDYFDQGGKAATIWQQNVSPMQEIVPRIERLKELFHKLGRPVVRTKMFEDLLSIELKLV